MKLSSDLRKQFPKNGFCVCSLQLGLIYKLKLYDESVVRLRMPSIQSKLRIRPFSLGAVYLKWANVKATVEFKMQYCLTLKMPILCVSWSLSNCLNYDEALKYLDL